MPRATRATAAQLKGRVRLDPHLRLSSANVTERTQHDGDAGVAHIVLDVAREDFELAPTPQRGGGKGTQPQAAPREAPPLDDEKVDRVQLRLAEALDHPDAATAFMAGMGVGRVAHCWAHYATCQPGGCCRWCETSRHPWEELCMWEGACAGCERCKGGFALVAP